MRFFAAADGTFVNVDHIATIEVVGPVTMRGENLNGTYEVRARTTIGWPTGGYAAEKGHLVILGERFRSELDAREWIVRNFNIDTDACTVGHLQRHA
jgi:hypothetical protein